MAWKPVPLPPTLFSEILQAWTTLISDFQAVFKDNKGVVFVVYSAGFGAGMLLLHSSNTVVSLYFYQPVFMCCVSIPAINPRLFLTPHYLSSMYSTLVLLLQR